jgi:hypothetical protein
VRAGLWALDGMAKLDLSKTWDASPFYYANGPKRSWSLGLSATLPYDTAWIDARRWDDARVVSLLGEYRWRGRNPSGLSARATVIGGLVADRSERSSRGFERAEVEGSKVAYFGARRQHGAMLRLFAGVSDNAPAQRSIGLSSLDPTETFGNHLLRGRGAPLARSDVHFAALGGAGVRGYSPLVRMRNVAAMNAQVTTALNTPRPRSLVPRVWLSAFVDGAWGAPSLPGSNSRLFADAGVGLSVRGAIFDQPLTARVDVPVWVRKAPGGGDRLHWVVSLNDLW